METVWVLLDRYEENYCSAVPCIPKTCSRRLSKKLWSVVSNAAKRPRTVTLEMEKARGRWQFLKKLFQCCVLVYKQIGKDLIDCWKRDDRTFEQDFFFYDLAQKREIWHTAKLFDIVVIKGTLFERAATADLWVCGKLPEVSESLTI